MSAIDELLASNGNPVQFFALVEKARVEVAAMAAERDQWQAAFEKLKEDVNLAELQRDQARDNASRLRQLYEAAVERDFAAVIERDQARAELQNAQVEYSKSLNNLGYENVGLRAEVERLKSIVRKMLDYNDGVLAIIGAEMEGTLTDEAREALAGVS